jgi:hypothetical protein
MVCFFKRAAHRRPEAYEFGAAVKYRKFGPENRRPLVGNEMENTGNQIDENESEKGLSNYELKRECFSYAKERFQGKKYLNHDTGREILVSRDGLDEWYSKTRSREQALSIKILDDLLISSKLSKPDTDRKGRDDVKSMDHFSRNCIINGKAYEARITIRTTREHGDKYYHHYLANIEIEPRSGILRPDETS